MRAAWVLLAVAGCGGCKDGSAAGAAEAGAPTATPTAIDAGPGVILRPGVPPAPPPRLPCRVVLASPNVVVEDAGILATAGEVPDGFVDLPAGAKLTAKDAKSGRETNFAGPGRVRACVAREEEAWVAKGDFTSAPGSGERPGGEQWVMTPLGVVMYAAEDVKVHVAAAEVDVDAKGAHARVWYPAGLVAPSPAGALLTVDTWSSMAVEHAVLKPAKAGSDLDLTNALVAKCGEAADAAQAAAKAMSSAIILQQLGSSGTTPDPEFVQPTDRPAPPADAGGFGALASQSVKRRQDAHAACGVARLRVAAMPPGPQKDAWTASTDAAEARWHEVSPRD